MQILQGLAEAVKEVIGSREGRDKEKEEIGENEGEIKNEGEGNKEMEEKKIKEIPVKGKEGKEIKEKYGAEDEELLSPDALIYKDTIDNIKRTRLEEQLNQYIKSIKGDPKSKEKKIEGILKRFDTYDNIRNNPWMLFETIRYYEPNFYEPFLADVINYVFSIKTPEEKHNSPPPFFIGAAQGGASTTTTTTTTPPFLGPSRRPTQGSTAGQGHQSPYPYPYPYPYGQYQSNEGQGPQESVEDRVKKILEEKERERRKEEEEKRREEELAQRIGGEIRGSLSPFI